MTLGEGNWRKPQGPSYWCLPRILPPSVDWGAKPSRGGCFSALRRAENVFDPPALRVEGPSNSQADVVPKVPEPNKVAPTSTLLASTDPSKKADRASTADKEKEPVKEKASEPTKLPPAPKDSSKAKGTT